MASYPKVHIEVLRASPAPEPVPFAEAPPGYGVLVNPDEWDDGNVMHIAGNNGNDLNLGEHCEQSAEGAWSRNARISMLQPGDAIVIIIQEE